VEYTEMDGVSNVTFTSCFNLNVKWMGERLTSNVETSKSSCWLVGV